MDRIKRTRTTWPAVSKRIRSLASDAGLTVDAERTEYSWSTQPDHWFGRTEYVVRTLYGVAYRGNRVAVDAFIRGYMAGKRSKGPL